MGAGNFYDDSSLAVYLFTFWIMVGCLFDLGEQEQESRIIGEEASLFWR